MAAMPGQYGCHRGNDVQQPQHQECGDEEMVGFAAQYSCSRSPLWVNATAPLIGGASHAHRAPTSAPTGSSPTATVMAARRRNPRRGTGLRDAHRRDSRSAGPPARAANISPTSRRAETGPPCDVRIRRAIGAAPDPAAPPSAPGSLQDHRGTLGVNVVDARARGTGRSPTINVSFYRLASDAYTMERDLADHREEDHPHEPQPIHSRAAG